ncbi:MAG: 2-C-methyl-D-erythritol 4-phosphate cytidylyltransferase [Candidatus Obscuribacterales bacterium]|nr:2-C-methyl-D-erythritol 4-phosphate cytidylyltransferase [Candidatus Obscuribacterales bacterium]
MIAAVVPAAGVGSRFVLTDNGRTKQFFKLLGRPTYIWSLSTLCAHELIDAVMLVLSTTTACKQVQEEVESYLTKEQAQKVLYTTGGDTRQESVFCGLTALATRPQKPDYVLVHDAARPFLTQALVSCSIKAARESGAFTLGVPVTDTIKRIKDGVIQETLDRSDIYAIQTPQGGKFQWLLDAHLKAKQENVSTTDDAAILEYSGHKVIIVDGSGYNIKLTKQEDIRLCEALAGLIETRESG